jgi:hypothetical protein
MAQGEKIVSDAHDAEAVHQRYVRLTEILDDLGTRIIESCTIGPDNKPMNVHDGWVFPKQEGVGELQDNSYWIGGGPGPALEHRLRTRRYDAGCVAAQICIDGTEYGTPYLNAYLEQPGALPEEVHHAVESILAPTTAEATVS